EEGVKVIGGRGGGGGEMNMPSRAACQPVTNQRRLVRGVVVHDQVYVEVGWHIRFDLVEELAEFARSVAGEALADDAAGGNVEGGEERCRAMARVVVAPPSRLAEAHWQHRLTAVERLDLRLLVDTEDDGLGWRRDIEADDVADLRHELRVGRKLERLQAVRLQAEGTPDALHRG